MIQAAKYLGVAPWELANRPGFWVDWGHASMWIDNEVKQRLQAREASRQKAQAKRGGGSGGSGGRGRRGRGRRR